MSSNVKGQENSCTNYQYVVGRIILIIQQLLYPVHVRTIEETLDKIISNKLSIARYGDGELYIMTGNRIDFQEYDKILANRLSEILLADDGKCLIAISPALESIKCFERSPQEYWIESMKYNRRLWNLFLRKGRKYYSANISRPYIDYKNKKQSEKIFELGKQIWNARNVLIVEGRGTRFGVGNDLLKNAKDVKRIICPEKNSFRVYNKVVREVLKTDKESLILIALGPTATVMAYDLSQKGYQAIDIGHFDIEYEWYLKGSRRKEKIQGKYTNEVYGGNIIEACNDEEYISQIIECVGVSI